MQPFLLFSLPPHLIPARLQEIAEYCGEHTALALLLHYPGVHIRVPKTPHATHKLAELLGPTAFAKLCEMYGDEVISIPRAAAAIRAARNQQILTDFASRMTQASIALKYGMTERQINHICNAVAIDTQLDIFSV